MSAVAPPATSPQAGESVGMSYLETPSRKFVTIYLPLIVFLVVLLFPFYWMGITSVKPDHELLSRTGPLAVSSANRSGMPAATDADAAEEMLGGSVAVILDDGPTTGPEPSTIVDVTGAHGRVLRLGAISLERLNEVVGPLGVTITDEG